MNLQAKHLVTVFTSMGILLCLANFFGADLFCATAGCQVYTWGKGFYLLGAGGFGVVLVLSWQAHRVQVERLLALTLAAGLAIDAALLAYQFLLWPCSSCLVVALLFGLAAAAAIKAHSLLRHAGIYALGGLWLVCFFAVGLSVSKDLVFQPWCLIGNPQAQTRVYFSPSCHGCEKVIDQLVETADLDQVGFFPIAKNAEDRTRISRVMALVEDSCKPADALKSLFQASTAPTDALGSREQFGLWCNKVALARTGSTSVPMIVSPQLPAGPLKPPVTKDGYSFSASPSYTDYLSRPSAASCSATVEESSCGS